MDTLVDCYKPKRKDLEECRRICIFACIIFLLLTLKERYNFLEIEKTSFASARTLLSDKILQVNTHTFEQVALEVFRFQAKYNPLYRTYLELIKRPPAQVDQLEAIPFLPIQFFKNHSIQTGQWNPTRTFTSSGTTGAITSRHPLYSESWYKDICRIGFEAFYGPLDQYCILALLPAYLERQNSSLVFMADYFIQQSPFKESGFFLYDQEALLAKIKQCQQKQIPTILLGVSFALWDLAEAHQLDYDQLIIMETGGMKGRRREITRAALHEIYLEAFKVEDIHSEYGMTELLSQAYSKGKGLFYPSPTMRVQGRSITDPFASVNFGKTAALNIIDLANLDTISFIATDDLGKVYADHSFEVLGRLDHSDLRGCNLLIDNY
jgi:hypothetical protein